MNNAMSNAELHDLIPMHALGALEPDEVPLLEAYLAMNPEARASYVWYLEAVCVLARSIPLEEPPQDLKAKMLDRVRRVNATRVDSARVDSAQSGSTRASSNRASSNRAGSNQAIPIRARDHAAESRVPIITDHTPPRVVQTTLQTLRLLPIAFAAMAAIIAGLFVQNLQLNNTLRTLEGSQTNLESFLASSKTKTVVLNSADGKAIVGVVMSSLDGSVLISHTMGALSGTKTWQAWYILKGETVPRPLGTTNAAHLMIHVPANAQVIAVSEEPAGGSQTPTTVRAIATL
jgi:Anti-sigma-K factor rskA